MSSTFLPLILIEPLLCLFMHGNVALRCFENLKIRLLVTAWKFKCNNQVEVEVEVEVEVHLAINLNCTCPTLRIGSFFYSDA